MPLFSRRPSREAALQKIYTDAYQASLQSILKESSFEFRGALDSWKATLAQITTGMAQLDGTPPRTGQEKSLLASVMDVERQCHDRIGALELRLEHARVAAGTSKSPAPVPNSPYGTHVSNPSGVDVSTLSLNGPADKKKPHRVAVGSKAAQSSSAVRSEPALGKLSVPNLVQMPRVSDMPYDLYKKKPSLPSQAVRSAPVLPTPQSSSSLSTATTAAQTSSRREPPPQRSSLDYPQPAPANHHHSMMTTLRSKNPLKSRPKSSPRSSVENNSLSDADDAKRTALTAAKQVHQQPDSPSQQFSGFEGAFRSESQPSSPTVAGGSPAIDQAPQIFAQGQQQQQQLQQQQQQQQYSQHNQYQQQPSHSHSQSQAEANAAAKRTAQFHVTYEQVPSSTGRPVYRPRVVRSAQQPHNHHYQHQHQHQQQHHHHQQSQGGSLNRSSPTSSQTALNGPRSAGQASQSAQQQQQQHQAPQKARVLADGSPEAADTTDADELDEWDRMAREKIKDLRGVDKGAAEQILSEVVLKGDHVTWEDIAGLDRAKASLKETVVYPFLRPDLFSGLREPVLGMLLFGPPGTGKTMLARAVATESHSTFFSISASSLTSKYMGESEKLVRALFQLAKALAPSIIFVDEIDSILTQRADSGEHEASRRIKNEFLVQWSDLQAAAAGKQNEDVRRVLVLGATNLPWAIDEAARRRFVRRQYIPLPEPYTRRVHIEKLLSRQKHGLNDGDIAQLVALTDGYSGSDLTALAKDAAMGPLRSLGDALLTTAPDQIRPMGMADFRESMRSIRPSVSPEGLRAFEQWADMYGSSGA